MTNVIPFPARRARPGSVCSAASTRARQDRTDLAVQALCDALDAVPMPALLWAVAAAQRALDRRVSVLRALDVGVNAAFAWISLYGGTHAVE